MRAVTKHFLNAGLVRNADQKRFGSYVLDTVRFHDSRLAEVVLVALAYLTTYVALSKTSLQSGSTWFVPSPDAGFSVAGYYYALVALPIFQFLMYRWAYRMIVWTRFLWRVSNFDLLLTPAHPDGAGGLGFLGKGTIPFGIVLFALSSVLSTAIASRILFGGAALEQFEYIYAAFVLLALTVFAGPLMVFAPRLFRLKQDGLLRYGALASQYTQAFDSKWATRINTAQEPHSGHSVSGRYGE